MIRALDASSAAAMAALHTVCFPRGWSVQEFETMLQVPHTLALGCGHDHALAAMLVVRSAGEDADILTLAVDATQRRHGLAQLLLTAAEVELHAQSVQRMVLEVAVVNAAALALYAKLGYREITRRPAYYAQADGTRADAVVMEKWLVAA